MACIETNLLLDLS